MRCDYCFYCDEAQKREQQSFGMMSEATLKNVIKRTLMRAEGSYTHAFQGGEPTLRGLAFFRLAVDLVRRYNKNGAEVHFALQTNGYVLDDEWCRFFAENRFLIGISVDGTKETHDRYRHDHDGQPTYDRVLSSVRLLEQHHVDFNILTVVNKETARSISAIYRDYRQKGWNYLQFITCLDPLYEAHGNREYSLLPEDYGRFLVELFDLWYADYRRGSQPYIRQFDNYIGILMGIRPEACEQCGVCAVQHVVEADGSVYPCDFYAVDEFRLGNLNTDLLPALHEKADALGFAARSRRHHPSCLACRWHELCRDACYRSRRLPEDGDEGLNYFCESYRMFFEACYPRLKEIAEEYMRRR